MENLINKYRAVYSVPEYEYKKYQLSSEETDRMMKDKIAINMSKTIMEKYSPRKTETYKGNYEYELELYVFNKTELIDFINKLI